MLFNCTGEMARKRFKTIHSSDVGGSSQQTASASPQPSEEIHLDEQSISERQGNTIGTSIRLYICYKDDFVCFLCNSNFLVGKKM